MSVILGVDWGRRRVGLASSDETGRLASPWRTIPAGPRAGLVRSLLALARERGAAVVVVGLPLNMDGTEGESAAEARSLAEDLKAAGLDVRLWDERLSSWEAEGRLKASGRKRISKDDKDRAAAAVFLQSYLNSQNSRPPDPARTREEGREVHDD